MAFWPAGVKALDPFFGRCAFPGLDINGDGGGHRMDRDGPPDCVMQYLRLTVATLESAVGGVSSRAWQACMNEGV